MSESSEWIKKKNRFAVLWHEVFDKQAMKALCSQVGERARTNHMIGSKKCGNGRLPCRGQHDRPPVQRVLSILYENKPNAWCVREVFLVDLAVLDLLGSASGDDADVWGDAYAVGKWKTLAFVEHENNVGIGGLVPTVRKLLDYRSDVLRVVIGYSEHPEDDWKDSAWRKMLDSADGRPRDSIVLVIGERKGSSIVAWYLVHFIGEYLEPLDEKSG